MAALPQKLVHWALDVSISDFGSPYSEASSSDSAASTSNLQYINSQLVAHGFTPSPGLSSEGLSNSDIEKLAKCLLAMLSQRVNDMSRTEDLSTKIRTLSYDHERLIGMHRSATEQAANAEREMNLYKSRLATASKALTASESAHKQTSAELQRTRSSLIALRATHSAELKKREKDIERIMEKWSKISDIQTKLSTSPSGLTFRCGNADVGNGSETLGKGKGYLEIALDQAESARASLTDETITLQRLVVSVANRLQSVLHELRCLISPCDEEPGIITHSVLFPCTPPDAASDKLSMLFSAAYNAIEDISQRLSQHTQVVAPTAPDYTKTSDAVERQRLQGIIDELRSELEEAKKLHKRYGAETQALLMQVASQASCTERHPMDSSVDLMTQPERDLAAERLERMKAELDEERRKFTDAAVKLGKEKAALEAEHIRFLEEKRSWQVEQMLSDLPPTPVQPSQPAPQSPPRAPTTKSSRKSPMKPKVVGKVVGRKTRVSRRSSSFSIPPPSKIQPAYETEVITVSISSSASEESCTKATSARSVLPSLSILPRRSPRASFPPVEALLPPTETTRTASIGKLYTSTDTDSASASSSDESSSDPSSPPAPAIPTIVLPAPLKTPVAIVANARRPFPIAKPLATHMSHAYSPARPSPLSRILMLADSPDSPDDVPEESEDSPTCAIPMRALPRESEPDDSPLREKKTVPNVAPLPPFKKVMLPEPKRLSTKDKAKAKLEPAAPGKLKSEKENRDKIPQKLVPPLISAPQPKLKLSSLTTSKSAPKLPTGKGGARRVLIGSAEAAPLPGWRG